jgi:uncharacterized membrane protein YgaE (UPF0421/DUF939 family)
MARGHRREQALRRLGPQADFAALRLRAAGQPSLRERLHRSRASLLLAVQAAVAAGLAWFIANNLLHHNQPVFAPIAAVIVLDVSIGQRLRRTAELVVGVALGIGIGDALIFAIGTGAWQVGLSVLLATVLSVFVAGFPAVVSQASTSAILIATLSPPKTGLLYSSRFIDALVGGGVALAVLALLLPASPIASVARKAGAPCGVIVDALQETAQALRSHNAQLADAALTRLGEAEQPLSEFRAAVPESKETALLSPLRWRVRGGLERYEHAAEYLDRVLTEVRVLIRRAVTMIHDDEPIPEALPRSVQTLADATLELRKSLRHATNSHRVRELALQAVSEAAEAYRARLGFSGSTVVAQVRAAATDLLGTADLSHAQANELVRKAGGPPHKP